MTSARSKLQYAGFWRRFGAVLIDGILLGIVSVALSVALGPEQSALPDFVIAFTYEVLGNGWGGTPGKRALGMRLVKASGEAPGLARSLLRSLVAVISLLVFLLGYLWAIWDSEKQTWQDKAAGTYVVMG